MWSCRTGRQRGDLPFHLRDHGALPGAFGTDEAAVRAAAAHAVRTDGVDLVATVTTAEPYVAGSDDAPFRVVAYDFGIKRSILDQLVHCEGLEEAEGMALMTGAGFQEEGEAAGKWRRALLTSAQLSTYFVGYTEVSAIGRARPAGTPVRQWHDTMLAHGSPPPRHLRALLGI